MGTRDEKIKLEVSGAAQSARDLDKVGDAAEGAGRSVAVMGKASDKAGKQVDDLGDEARDASRDVAALNDELEDSAAAAIKAGLAYRDVNGKLRDMRNHFTSLARLQKQMGGPGGGGGGGGGRGPGWLGTVGGMAGQVGQIGSTVASGISGSPVLMGTAIAGGIAAAPAIGGAVGGAVLAGGAVGAVGAGVAGAVKGDNGDAIKAEFESLTSGLRNRWLSSTKDWYGPIMAGLGHFGDALEDLPLEETLGNAKKYVEPLAKGFADLGSGVARGVNSLVREAGPVVERLSEEFSELGDDADEALTAISMGSQGGADALGDILDVTGALVVGFGKTVMGAEMLYQKLQDNPLTGWGHDLFMGLIEGDPVIQQTGRSLDGTAEAANRTESAWEGADAAMQGYLDTADRLFDTQMGAAAASIAWEQSVDDLNDTLKENGKNWDTSTQKGRDNTLAVMDAIEAAKKVRDENIANGKSIADENAAYEAKIKQLEKTATQAGMTKQKFDELTGGLRNYISEPADKTITIRTIRIEDRRVSYEGVVEGGDPRRNTGGLYAAGGTVRETGFSLVGENGPELRWLNKGDYISTASETSRMMSGGGSAAGRSGAAGWTMPPMAVIEHALCAVLIKLMQDGQLPVPSTAVV